MLLEVLYGAFDKLALQQRVFKVETIGDCYVAAAGLVSQPTRVVLLIFTLVSKTF
jgi:Adenylate and Guanylate cyclase catalytic domain